MHLWRDASTGDAVVKMDPLPPPAPLSAFNDAEITAEYHRRCLKMLGDQREGVCPFPRFVVCSTCGNKRCPRAGDERFRCTGSNELGQVGVFV